MLNKGTVLVAFATVFVAIAGAGSAFAASLRSTEASLLNTVNQTRAAYGLQPVRRDVSLTRAARSHSHDMLRHQYFSHGNFARRMRVFGARDRTTGENLAWGVGALASSKAIVQEWLASPSHRANLLRPGFDRIGIGAFRGSFNGTGGAVVVTADFGGA